MRAAVPRVYQSFSEFEREELRKLDTFTARIDDMLEDMFHEELDFSGESSSTGGRGRGGRRRAQSNDE